MSVTASRVQSGPLDLNLERRGTTTSIEVAGELDLATVDSLGTLLAACEVAGTETVLLDLGRLEFIDSAGIALLLHAHRRLGAEGGFRLRVIPSRAPAVRRMLSLTGLDTTLTLVEERARGHALS